MFEILMIFKNISNVFENCGDTCVFLILKNVRLVPNCQHFSFFQDFYFFENIFFICILIKFKKRNVPKKTFFSQKVGNCFTCSQEGYLKVIKT